MLETSDDDPGCNAEPGRAGLDPLDGQGLRLEPLVLGRRDEVIRGESARPPAPPACPGPRPRGTPPSSGAGGRGRLRGREKKSWSSLLYRRLSWIRALCSLSHRVAPEIGAPWSSGTQTSATPAAANSSVMRGWKAAGSSRVSDRAVASAARNPSRSNGAQSTACASISPRRNHAAIVPCLPCRRRAPEGQLARPPQLLPGVRRRHAEEAEKDGHAIGGRGESRDPTQLRHRREREPARPVGPLGQPRSMPPPRERLAVAGLPLHPERRGRAEHRLELQCRVSLDGRLALDDLVDGFARASQAARELGLAHAQGLEGLGEGVPWGRDTVRRVLVDRTASHGSSRWPGS